MLSQERGMPLGSHRVYNQQPTWTKFPLHLPCTVLVQGRLQVFSQSLFVDITEGGDECAPAHWMMAPPTQPLLQHPLTGQLTVGGNVSGDDGQNALLQAQSTAQSVPHVGYFFNDTHSSGPPRDHQVLQVVGRRLVSYEEEKKRTHEQQSTNSMVHKVPYRERGCSFQLGEW